MKFMRQNISGVRGLIPILGVAFFIRFSLINLSVLDLLKIRQNLLLNLVSLERYCKITSKGFCVRQILANFFRHSADLEKLCKPVFEKFQLSSFFNRWNFYQGNISKLNYLPYLRNTVRNSTSSQQIITKCVVNRNLLSSAFEIYFEASLREY